jgi:hypothetical protein
MCRFHLVLRSCGAADFGKMQTLLGKMKDLGTGVSTVTFEVLFRQLRGSVQTETIDEAYELLKCVAAAASSPVHSLTTLLPSGERTSSQLWTCLPAWFLPVAARTT